MNKFVVCAAALLLAAGALKAEDAKTQSVEFGRDKKHTITIPAAWKNGEASGMRAAEITVPKQGEDKDDAEIAIFMLGAGGGVDANVNRWAGQFGGADAIKNKRSVKTVGGLDATIVEIEGSYKGMGKNGPMAEAKDNYKLLGAILNDGGDVFIKLIGPKATVDASKAAFDKLVESFK
jgi:hypothetical protein